MQHEIVEVTAHSTTSYQSTVLWVERPALAYITLAVVCAASCVAEFNQAMQDRLPSHMCNSRASTSSWHELEHVVHWRCPIDSLHHHMSSCSFNIEDDAH